MSRRVLSIALALLVTVVLLVLVIRAIPPAELGETLGQVSPFWMLAGAAGAFVSIVMRAARYRMLLSMTRGRFPRVLMATLAGWGVSLLLPGPSGEAALIVLLRRRLAVPLTVGTGAMLLSRLLDGASLLVLVLVTAPLAGVHLPGILLVGGIALAAVIVTSLVALFWERPRRRITGWLERLPLPQAWHQRLHAAIEELGNGSQPLLLVSATVIARLATGLQYLALFTAIHQSISLVQVWFALSVRTLLFAIPVQGIGGLGTSQLWWSAGLTLLGWPLDDALAASLAVHLIDLSVSLPQAAIGAVLLMTRRAESVPLSATAAPASDRD